MVSVVVPTRRGHDAEKKCSLLIQFVLGTNSRGLYTQQVKNNLPTYLRGAEKVKIKVGRDALTITDRTVWHNKLERIPISLIIDTHIDTENPLICYFVSEAINSQFRVIAIFCKTSTDSHKLVNSCKYHNKMIDWYNDTRDNGSGSDSKSLHQLNHQRISANEMPDDMFMLPSHMTNSNTLHWDVQTVPEQHSNGKSQFSHDNCLAEERQPAHIHCSIPGHHYDPGEARIVVGGNRSTPKLKKHSSAGSPENTLYKVTPNTPRLMPLQLARNTRSPVRKYADGFNSSLKRKETAGHVEEEFVFLPNETINRGSTGEHGYSSYPRHLSYLTDQTNVNPGLSMVRVGDNNTRRRQGQYASIQEYEEAQRNGTISSSSSLQATSGSENIAPHMSLVLKDKEYLIHHGNQFRQNNHILHQNRSPSPSRRQGWQVKPIQQHHSHPNNGLQLVDGGRFQKDNWRPTSKSAPAQSRSRARIQTDTYQTPTQLDLQPQQLSNQLQLQPAPTANQLQTQPIYQVKTHGKGDNFLKNEALTYDDDNNYYRQHGQRVRKTQDGGQHLFLDKRLAETKDVVGNQVVKGRHSQKVHSGESVGANHLSKFHSEVMVSHKTSQPVAMQPLPAINQQNIQSLSQSKNKGRKNSQPVKVTTHQWPPVDFDAPDAGRLHFNQPGNMNFNFHNNFAAFQTNEPLQRFFRPNYNPRPNMNFNPGFQRFFESIDDYGPQTQHAKMVENNPVNADPNVASVIVPSRQQTSRQQESRQQAIGSPKVEYPTDNESETSSIRSSASAYWPPELKFSSTGEDESDWKFHKPNIKLRRKPLGTNVHRNQRRLI